MHDTIRPSRALLDWYRGEVRALLEQHAPSKLPELDDDARRVEALEQLLSEELAVCFLGESGVGKSTLINAVVAGRDTVLPAGGVGPLTALGMEVRHSDRPAFEVSYHKAGRLWQVVFGLERGRAAELGTDPTPSSEGSEAPEDIDGATEAEDEVRAEEDSGNSSDRLHLYMKQAQLLVTGNQDGSADLKYLLDSVRQVLGKPRVWGTAPRDDDSDRLRRIQAALHLAKAGKTHRVTGRVDDDGFRNELHAHAAGFLAPLIRELDVHWPSDLLSSGLTLVDLPGLGGAVDVFKEETAKWVRQRAKAIVLVVDRVGITESSANLLRESGFLTRLLFSNDDPTADPVILLVAVVQMDNIAREHWRADRSRSRHAHFADVQERMIPVVKNQLRQQLEKVWASVAVDGVASLSEGKTEVIERVLRGVQVYPLSATEYRMVVTGDPDDPPFLQTPEQTGVPNLIDALRAVVLARRRDAQERVAKAMDVLWSRSVAAVQVVKAQWSGQTRAQEEAERLERDLESYVRPLRDEFATRRGSYREFLREGIPNRIDALVKEARDTARREFQGYLRRRLPRDTHWATLRAIVRKRGRHSGVIGDVDLPGEFARRFEDPLAEVWSKDILKNIRRRTNEFAQDCLGSVDQVVQWARGQGARVQPQLVEAIEDDIKGDIKKIDAIGKEVINDLRDKVRQRLLKSLERAIERQCKAFIDRGEDQGTGVKRRIWEELLPTLAEEAAEAGLEPASKILRECYEEVRGEMQKSLRTLENPLDTAVLQLVESHRERLERSDAQRRKAVLAAVERALDMAPRMGSAEPEVAL